MKNTNTFSALRAAVAALAGLGLVGGAHAANSLTEAGREVSNTFVLNYSVGTTPQNPITNDTATTDPNAVIQGTPTEFTVDRKVDHSLTATNSPLNNTAPSSTATLTFELLNEGNDTQAYSFSLADLDNGTDTFDSSAYVIRATLDTADDGTFAGTPTILTATPVGTAAGSADVSVDVPKGVRMLIEVIATVPSSTETSGGPDDQTSADDTETDTVILIAEARNPTAWLNDTVVGAGEVTANTGGANVIVGDAQNVLADDVGVAAVEDAANSDGLHAAEGVIVIASPDLEATKGVVAISELIDALGNAPADPVADCTSASTVANAKTIPGACIEYVIEVENTGSSATASNLNIADVLSDDVIFVSVSLTTTTTNGFQDDPAIAPATGPTLTAPAAGTACDGTAGTCEITLTNAILASGEVGQIRIRALVE
ncbi:MAG: hypothetical protein AAFR74_04825 [Pseudomonadota bacterium]